jgi:hypothetical protein
MPSFPRFAGSAWTGSGRRPLTSPRIGRPRAWPPIRSMAIFVSAEPGEDARGEIVRDYLADRDERPDGTRVAMAHRRADVRAINEAIRAELQDRGELARVAEDGPGRATSPSDVDHEREGPGRALTFQTNDGKRDFATGDRIVFLENSRDLGVKNGMLGTVDHVEPGRIIATLDEKPGRTRFRADGRLSGDRPRLCDDDSQEPGRDRRSELCPGVGDDGPASNLCRHDPASRRGAALRRPGRVQRPSGRQAGRLVEHGAAPYEHQAGKSDSYFVTLENDKGQRNTGLGRRS